MERMITRAASLPTFACTTAGIPALVTDGIPMATCGLPGR